MGTEDLWYILRWMSGVRVEANVRCQQKERVGECGRSGFSYDLSYQYGTEPSGSWELCVQLQYHSII